MIDSINMDILEIWQEILGYITNWRDIVRIGGVCRNVREMVCGSIHNVEYVDISSKMSRILSNFSFSTIKMSGMCCDDRIIPRKQPMFQYDDDDLHRSANEAAGYEIAEMVMRYGRQRGVHINLSFNNPVSFTTFLTYAEGYDGHIDLSYSVTEKFRESSYPYGLASMSCANVGVRRFTIKISRSLCLEEIIRHIDTDEMHIHGASIDNLRCSVVHLYDSMIRGELHCDELHVHQDMVAAVTEQPGVKKVIFYGDHRSLPFPNAVVSMGYLFRADFDGDG